MLNKCLKVLKLETILVDLVQAGARNDSKITMLIHRILAKLWFPREVGFQRKVNKWLVVFLSPTLDSKFLPPKV